jgi:spermidine synthase
LSSIKSTEGRPALSDTQGALNSRERLLTLVTAVICGAAVMEVELLGARVLSPWFGVSFFVWTALITITLLSLAAGYYAGGRLADKRASLKTLSMLVGLSGLFLLSVPLFRVATLRAGAGLGIRAGALVSAALLFGPTLMLLGTVTPFAVKLILKDIRDAGRTVGRLSALSTFGSFAGTLATGFWIIPSFHVDQIAAGTAVILSALSVSLWIGAGGKKLFILLAIPGLFFLKPPPLADVIQANGTRARVICREESFYGQISVVEYSFSDRKTREMLVDGIIQGAIDAQSGEPIYPYTYYLEQASLNYNSGAKKALVIGLGAAILPKRLKEYGLSGTVVEIDPQIARVAEKYFDFAPDVFKLAIEDGRTFLEHNNDLFDIVLLDAFSAENEPSHMFTVEAFEAVRRRLNTGGVLAVNLPGPAPGSAADAKVVTTIINTMGAVFPRVVAFVPPVPASGEIINYTLVGILPGGSCKRDVFAPLPVHPMSRAWLDGFLKSVYIPESRSSDIYTDGWVPLEAQNARSKLIFRESEIASTPPEILLN